MTSAGALFRFTRGLRFRLALSYVFFFTILLIALGLLFRETLSVIFENQMQDTLREEFGAVKPYLDPSASKLWFYDPKEPDEAFTVERLRRVYMLADTEGHVLERSVIYDSIGVDSPSTIKAILASGKPATRILKDKQGIPYMIHSGLFVDMHGHHYYVAIGRAIDQNNRVLRDFTRNYFTLVPALMFLSCLLGWFLAGRALQPVNSVARAAERITHSNLDMQIPLRHTGDELDRLIQAFNHMMRRLSASFEQIRQFSADVSHELRTPLTVVRGQLEVALFTAQTTDQYREAMVNALEDVDRLSNIVRALLMLSQAESGQLVLQKTPLDFTALVREQVEQYQIPAEANAVQLTSDLLGNCTIQADKIQIERLVSNLLSNAVKYTPSGGRVMVRLSCERDRAKLVVEDTGVGIASEHLPHIFERFYRVPSADPEKGMGLGLSFVSWIVKAHGGSVNVESEPHQGTRFTVLLPAGPQPPADFAESPALPLGEQVH